MPFRVIDISRERSIREETQKLCAIVAADPTVISIHSVLRTRQPAGFPCAPYVIAQLFDPEVDLEQVHANRYDHVAKNDCSGYQDSMHKQYRIERGKDVLLFVTPILLSGRVQVPYHQQLFDFAKKHGVRYDLSTRTFMPRKAVPLRYLSTDLD